MRNSYSSALPTIRQCRLRSKLESGQILAAVFGSDNVWARDGRKTGTSSLRFTPNQISAHNLLIYK
jgi:hypothetical protein